MNFNQLEREIEHEFAKSNWRIGGEKYRNALMQEESVKKTSRGRDPQRSLEVLGEEERSK